MGETQGEATSIGILMLETRFPRIPGDVGNARTWPFPVRYRVVPGATPEAVVRGDPTTLMKAFVEAGQALIDQGCDGIATTCGFLVPLQDRLAAALGVPVATSSLMQVPAVQATLPAGRRVGILTIAADSLTAGHLGAAGVAVGTPVVGTAPEGAFAATFLGDRPTIDVSACRADMLEAADRLSATVPDLGAIVLECTNMAPYAAAIRRRTGLPVYSIYSFMLWFQAGLAPRRFAASPDD
jgi:Asp/Glu/hydantoin racemase